MIRAAKGAFLVAALFVPASVPHAHAFLDHASPAVGSSIHQAPKEVRLWFTQPLEPAFSAVHVFDGDHRKVEQDDSHVESTDASILVLALPGLAPGRYRVEWRVLSVDTHVSQGDFTFDVTP